MKIKVKFSYIENEIPKKCRIPRDVRHDDGVVVCNVREVTSADAPVAIIAKGKRRISKNIDQDFTFDYRFYKGDLYTSIRMRGADVTSFTSGKFDYDNPALPDTIDITDYRYNRFDLPAAQGSEDVVKRAIKRSIKRHLIVDGAFYRKVCEPYYKVCVFGLGRNHGGTALMTEAALSRASDAWSFSLLQKEEALAKAAEVAQARGDSESLPMAVNGYEYQVLIPEAIKVNRK
jgi:hypothetical protein